MRTKILTGFHICISVPLKTMLLISGCILLFYYIASIVWASYFKENFHPNFLPRWMLILPFRGKLVPSKYWKVNFMQWQKQKRAQRWNHTPNVIGRVECPWNQGYLPYLKTKKKKSIIKLWIKYDNNDGSKANINKMERNRPISNSFFNILDHLFLSN